ncbi:hypothetical protein [Bacteroides thetaiotaomicron]|uniref:hypothetical protein n=1 Tax=Bacteroides thetaiotaomicron TaxID=818 RepID=UPI0012DA34C1|nr:hypothetical protein [Bacteroides thetaiotaomicron]
MDHTSCYNENKYDNNQHGSTSKIQFKLLPCGKLFFHRERNRYRISLYQSIRPIHILILIQILTFILIYRISLYRYIYTIMLIYAIMPYAITSPILRFHGFNRNILSSAGTKSSSQYQKEDYHIYQASHDAVSFK